MASSERAAEITVKISAIVDLVFAVRAGGAEPNQGWRRPQIVRHSSRNKRLGSHHGINARILIAS